MGTRIPGTEPDPGVSGPVPDPNIGPISRITTRQVDPLETDKLSGPNGYYPPGIGYPNIYLLLVNFT